MTDNAQSPAYDELVAALRKAVPSLWHWTTIHTTKLDRKSCIHCEQCGKIFDPPCMECGCEYGTTRTARPITLEDVLRALGEEAPMMSVMTSTDCKLNVFLNTYDNQKAKWHLGNPLSEQPVKTITFLHSLLCPPSK